MPIELYKNPSKSTYYSQVKFKLIVRCFLVGLFIFPTVSFSQSSISEIIYLNDFSIMKENLFIGVDKIQFKLFQFDLDGKILKGIGRKGAGPGEFNNEPYKIDYNEITNKISIIELGSNTIKIFDNNLDFEKIIVTKVPVQTISHTKSGGLIIGSLPYRANIKSIYVYNSSYSLGKSFSPEIDQINLIFDAFNITVTDDNLICLGFIYRNIIQLYDLTGQKINEFSIPNMAKVADSEILNNPNQAGVNELPLNKLTYDIEVHDNMIFILHAFEKNRLISKFDLKGNLISTYQVGINSTNFEISENKIFINTKNKVESIDIK